MDCSSTYIILVADSINGLEYLIAGMSDLLGLIKAAYISCSTAISVYSICPDQE